MGWLSPHHQREQVDGTLELCLGAGRTLPQTWSSQRSPPLLPRSSPGSAPGCRIPSQGSARSQGAGTCAARPPLKTSGSLTQQSWPVLKRGPPIQLGLPLPPKAEGTRDPSTHNSQQYLLLLRGQVILLKPLSDNPALLSGTLTLVKVVTRRAARVCEAWLGDGFLLAGLSTNGPLSQTVIC